MTATATPSTRRRWRPSPLGAALTILGGALFIQLGSWQMGRAELKRSLLEQYARGQQTLVEITSENADSLPRYQRVQVTGRYDLAHQILLDNMPSHAGQPGYRVVTPMDTNAGWLLVDRGWLPLGRTRKELPDIAVDDTQRTVTGTLDTLPQAGLELETPPIDPSRPWPRVLNFPKHDALEQQLGRELIPGLLLLDASQPDGYERVWEAHIGIGPERHVGYAVQWFALAAAALVIFIVTSFRNPRTLQDRTPKATDEPSR